MTLRAGLDTGSDYPAEAGIVGRQLPGMAVVARVLPRRRSARIIAARGIKVTINPVDGAIEHPAERAGQE